MSVRVLREAIEADEEPAPPPVVAELALAQFAAGHREEAEGTLTALLGDHDDYADGHYLLANMLAARRAFDDAARHYQRYLRLEPRGPLAAEAQGRLQYVRRQ
jgi:tetratricopeptide (TPR) repeat protein